jgi:hypothetical protein
MDYFKHAQNLIAESNGRPKDTLEHKWLTQLNMNNYVLLHAKDYLNNLLEIENPDAYMQEEIVKTNQKIENVRQAIILLHKAFMESI